jgi:hypothetical protein
MKTLLTSALLLISLNSLAEIEPSYTDNEVVTHSEIVASMNKGVCENVCNYVCNNKWCEMINGVEVCKEDCGTVCEYVCE